MNTYIMAHAGGPACALAAMVEASMRIDTGGAKISVSTQMASAGVKDVTRQMLKRERDDST